VIGHRQPGRAASRRVGVNRPGRIDYNHIIIAWHISILHHSHGRYIVHLTFLSPYSTSLSMLKSLPG
jgi:hypothetical protein